MLTTQAEKRWQAELATPSLLYPRDLTHGVQRDREFDLYADSTVQRVRDRGGRSTMLADLWEIFQEMKTVDPDVTDREVVQAYHHQHPEKTRVTTKTLRGLRYRRRKGENRRLDGGV